MRIKTRKMKTRNFIQSIFLFVMVFFANNSWSQEPQNVINEVKRPIYETLGISSTYLFMVMVLFTIFLIIILVAVAQSTKNIIIFKSKLKNKGKSLLVIGFLLFSSQSFAQDNINTAPLIEFTDNAFWAFIILDVIIIMFILYLVGIMKGALSEFAPKNKPVTIFSKWNKTLTNAVEIEDEASILLDHEYDGIKELDNDLPPWWKYGFYITIVWSVFYLGYYTFFGGLTQAQEYEAEILQSEKDIAAYKAAHPELITVDNVELLTDQSSLTKGKRTYDENCASCHGLVGEGGIGPNLTDEYWLYGGDIKGVFQTVSQGANNGMAAWKELISADKIQEVSSYVLSLPTAANGKEPQGENIVKK